MRPATTPHPTRADRATVLNRASWRCEAAPSGRPCPSPTGVLTLVPLDPAAPRTPNNLKAMCRACAAAHENTRPKTASAPPAATPDTAPLF